MTAAGICYVQHYTGFSMGETWPEVTLRRTEIGYRFLANVKLQQTIFPTHHKI